MFLKNDLTFSKWTSQNTAQVMAYFHPQPVDRDVSAQLVNLHHSILQLTSHLWPAHFQVLEQPSLSAPALLSKL